MKSRESLFVFVFICSFVSVFSQTQQSFSPETESKFLLSTEKSKVSNYSIDPLRPSKAAFYSAVLPGLGQAYNKKYWKVPIAIGGVVLGIAVYDFHSKRYHRFRDAYKSRLAGFNTDEFWGLDALGVPLLQPRVSNEALIRVQKRSRKNRELSLLLTIGVYILNIIDANVDAHLLQYNVDEKLSLKPHLKNQEFNNKANFGLTFHYSF